MNPEPSARRRSHSAHRRCFGRPPTAPRCATTLSTTSKATAMPIASRSQAVASIVRVSPESSRPARHRRRGADRNLDPDPGPPTPGSPTSGPGPRLRPRPSRSLHREPSELIPARDKPMTHPNADFAPGHAGVRASMGRSEARTPNELIPAHAKGTQSRREPNEPVIQIELVSKLLEAGPRVTTPLASTQNGGSSGSSTLGRASIRGRGSTVGSAGYEGRS